MVDRAGRKKLIGDDAVLAVEVEDVEPLDWAANGESVMQTSA
jgi:phenylpyruvate tautomerase PptA (4-oxalocrotonate tautomerase family)